MQSAQIKLSFFLGNSGFGGRGLALRYPITSPSKMGTRSQNQVSPGGMHLFTHLFRDDSEYEQILCFPEFISNEKKNYVNLYVNSVWPWGSWHGASGAAESGILAVVSRLML